MRRSIENAPELDDLGLLPESYYRTEVAKRKQQDRPIVCSFCFKPLDVSVATQGTMNPRIRVEIEATAISEDPYQLRVEKKIRFQSDKVMACPDCCLKIKPQMEKCPTCRGRRDLAPSCTVCKGTGETGKVLSQGVKFPQTRG